MRAWLLASALLLAACEDGRDGSGDPEPHESVEQKPHGPGEHERHATRDEGPRDGAGDGREEHAGQEDPKQAGHDGSKRRVELTPEARKLLDLRIEPARAGRLQGTVTAPVTIEHDTERVAHISPLVEGQVDRLEASLGDEVETGDVVAIMHSVALGDARASIAEARASLDVARANFARQKKLHAEDIASERAYVEAKGRLREAEARHHAAVARLRTLGVSGGSGPTYLLRSRIAGTIIEQHASIGETKSPSDVLFVVADQSRVWAMGRVYERDVADIAAGMKAVVRLDAYPGRTFEGEVDWAASTVDEKTRNLPVRVELDNPDGVLRPGLFGRVRLVPQDTPADRALVPIDALQQMGKRKVVFVPGEGEGAYEAVPVEIRAEGERLVEVTGGIEPGREIVVEGAFDLLSAFTASSRSAAHHH